MSGEVKNLRVDIDLSEANFIRVDFRNANLSDADPLGANLE